MPKYIKAPQNTYFQPKESKIVAGNKKWFKKKKIDLLLRPASLRLLTLYCKLKCVYPPWRG